MMKTFEAESHHFQVTAPEHWDEVTEKWRIDDALLALVRTISRRSGDLNPRYVGMLYFWFERRHKSDVSRSRPKDLLEAILEEAKSKKRNPIGSNMIESGQRIIAGASFTDFDSLLREREFVRMWRVTEKLVMAKAVFVTGYDDVSEEELLVLIAECEEIVRSIRFKK